MRTLATVLAIAFLAAPAHAECQRSPFTGMVFCGENVPSFANEEVQFAPRQRPRQTVCDSHYYPGGIDTTCHEE